MMINKKDIQKTFLLICTLLLAVAGVIVGGMKLNEWLTDNQILAVSLESGFYTENITVSVKSRRTGIIYYTEDGSEPDKENHDTTKQYEKPITIQAMDTEQVKVYRFKVYYPDDTRSEVVTNTYCVGKNIESRYDTLVMNISTAPDNLYGYEEGIFVEGKIRDDYMAEHPEEEIDSDTPANFNLRGKESERPAHLEVFEPDGTRVLTQDIGIRTSGGTTRTSEQKSFKVYGRYEYSEDNKLKYPFFMDELQQEGNTVVDRYECLKIRNTGNDRLEAFIRDELGMRLAEQAGLQDVQYVRPVSVYFNGIYHGLYWIHSVYDDSYFKERYGKYKGEMVVVGQQEGNMSVENTKEIENQCAEEYNNWYGEIRDLDLTVPENYAKVEETIDVDNYLQYMAAETYMGNQDWPYNNEKIYRYVASDNDYQEGTVFDGRYRFLIYDVDTSMGHGYIVDTMDASATFTGIQNLIDNNLSALFAGLMQREDCKKTYVQYLCSLMNGAYSYENVCKVLDEMDAERDHEMQAYIQESERNENLTDISDYYTHMQMDSIREWARVTPDNLVANLKEQWQMGESYQLGIVIPEGAEAYVNDMKVDAAQWTGTYLTGCDTVLHAVVPTDRTFVGWQIAGQAYYEKDVRITEDMIVDGMVYAVLFTEDNQAAGLSIQAVKAKGSDDYILITNHTLHPESTKGYYVADKDKVSHMNYLPEQMLQPGETIKVICRSNVVDTIACVMRTNFNLSEGEQVILGHTQHGIIDRVKLPKLNLTNGVYTKDPITEIWTEKPESTENDSVSKDDIK